MLSVESFQLQDGNEAEAKETCCSSRQQTSRVLSEADSPEYWFAASRDGSRESHYRGEASGIVIDSLLDDLAPVIYDVMRNV